MGKSLFSACFGTTKAVGEGEDSASRSQHTARYPVSQLQLVSFIEYYADQGATRIDTVV